MNSTPSSPRKFRPEIQGLRAFAVTLVAIYHIWLGRVSGGVDIFLLISAFLMTLSFTRKIESGQPIFARAVLRYWVHTFKRILPLATVVVLATLWGTWQILPAPRWAGIMEEAKAVILYRENWWSISNMVDYYAADSSEASPLRHFWSLSVQGQIFIIWPLLFALCWVLYKIFRRRPRVILFSVFGTVFGLSLAYSVWLTGADQEIAYFSTWTRLWEFALGSLLAIALPWIRIPQHLRGMLGWVALVAIVSCGIILDVEGAFPGYIALWPTLAAAAIIAAGESGTRWGADRFLSTKPMLWLGKYSYGLYLIHWPLLVFYLYKVQQEKADLFAGLILLLVSVALSWILTNVIERPLRSWSWLDARNWRSALVIAACTLAVITVSNQWSADLQRQQAEIQANAAVDNPGAQVLQKGFDKPVSTDAQYLPLSAERYDDRPIYANHCAPEVLKKYGFEEWNCNQLVANEKPTQKVIAVGNSHMDQWGDALIALAKKEGWDLQYVQFNDCYFLEPSMNTEKPDCQAWVENTQRYIDGMHPDQVIIIGTISLPDEGGEIVPTGLRDFANHMQQQGIGLIALRDNPRFKETHADCETRTKGLCDFDSELARTPSPLTQFKDIPVVAPVDMTDIICPNGSCPSEIGNVYVYRDDSHLTRTYVLSAKNIFIQRVEDAIAEREARNTQ